MFFILGDAFLLFVFCLLSQISIIPIYINDLSH